MDPPFNLSVRIQSELHLVQLNAMRNEQLLSNCGQFLKDATSAWNRCTEGIESRELWPLSKNLLDMVLHEKGLTKDQSRAYARQAILLIDAAESKENELAELDSQRKTLLRDYRKQLQNMIQKTEH